MEERITGQKQMAREIHIKGLSLYIVAAHGREMVFTPCSSHLIRGD
jgi:hypothetical protein